MISFCVCERMMNGGRCRMMMVNGDEDDDGEEADGECRRFRSLRSLLLLLSRFR